MKIIRSLVISLALGVAISGGIHYKIMDTLKMHHSVMVETLEGSSREDCSKFIKEKPIALCKDSVLRSIENNKTPEFKRLLQVNSVNQEKFILSMDDVHEFNKANMAYVKVLMLNGVDTQEERDQKVDVHKEIEEAIFDGTKSLGQTLILTGIGNAIWFSLFIGGVPALISFFAKKIKKKTEDKE